MKSCPKCGTNYADDTLSYCLADGAVLNYAGEGKNAESGTGATQRMRPGAVRSTVGGSRTTLEKKGSGRFWKLTTFGLLGVLIGGSGLLWAVYPERFRALSAAIPLPEFSSAGQPAGTASGEGQRINASEKNSSDRRPDRLQTSPKDKKTADPAPAGEKSDSAVTGRWEIELRTPRRNYPLFFDLALNQEGTVTGESNSPFGKEEIRDGTFENGVLTVKLTRPFGMTFVGTINGEKIEGAVSTKLGPTTFSGKKIKKEDDRIENGRR